MDNKKKQSSLLSEIDFRVAGPAIILFMALTVYCILFEETANATFSNFFNEFVINLTSPYLWYQFILTGVGIYFICSKYGKVVLGKPDERPTTSNFKYVAVILAMAFGSTIMRTGMIHWAQSAIDPAFGITPMSPESMIYGNSYAMFTWGFAMFAIFGTAAPAIGYYLHVRNGSSIKMSTLLAQVFGAKFEKSIWGILADIVFIIAFVCGGATIVGFSTPVAAAVVSDLIGVESSLGMQIGLTMTIVVIFTISCCLGLKKGIEKLSEFNIYLAMVFGLLMLLLGPTLLVIDLFTDTIGSLIQNYIPFSFYANSTGEVDSLQSYTVFWIAYSTGWCIIHSAFLAIISKGRTIRQMLLTYFLAPQIIVVTYTGILGGVGMGATLEGKADVFSFVANGDLGGAVAAILRTLPMNSIMMVIYVVLFITFLATTMDSYTYTGATYICKNDLSKVEPSRKMRLLWAAFIAVLAITMMIIGGLAPLDVVNGIIGIPMIFLQGLVIYSSIKMMNDDKAYIYNVRKPEFDTIERQS